MTELSSRIVDEIARIVGDRGIKRGNLDASIECGINPGNLDAGLAVSPLNVDQVCELVRYCAQHAIEIVPHGGRTGVSGAAESRPGQLIIQTSKLDKILELDAVGGVAVVEAGVKLQQLQEAAAAQGLSTGIDLGARGSATVGGMVATNAGGTEAFRNGTMRHQVLGLEAVLPDGSVFSDLKRVVKANEGYDIKQLLIGSEGTLGMITKIVLDLVPLHSQRSAAMVSCENARCAATLFQVLRARLGGDLLHAEIMWPDYARTTANALGLSRVVDFSQQAGDIYVILGAGGIDDESSRQFLEEALSESLSSELINNALVAQNAREADQFWRVREESFVCDKLYPHGFWYDVSVPLNHLDDYSRNLFRKVSAVDPELRVFLYGHLGDGNLHLTISSGESCPQYGPSLDEAVYSGLTEMGGSFSAEHGIGTHKVTALTQHCDTQKLALMHAIKSAIDPKGIMNPGKVLHQRPIETT